MLIEVGHEELHIYIKIALSDYHLCFSSSPDLYVLLILCVAYFVDLHLRRNFVFTTPLEEIFFDI